MTFFHVAGTDLRKHKPGKVRIACSYRYNGGTIINGKRYSGFKVDPPILPKGYELIDIAVGLELNAHPPMQLMIMRKKK